MGVRILATIDFSDITDAVLNEAGTLGTALDAKIYLLHVATISPDVTGLDFEMVYNPATMAEEMKQHHDRLMNYKQLLWDRGLDVEAILEQGDPIERILDRMKELQPTMAVMGSHGHGALMHLLAGSVCQGVIKHAPCPVLIVPYRAYATQETRAKWAKLANKPASRDSLAP